MGRNDYDAYTAEYYTQYNNTISSGETRIPICFCIDVSSSMSILTNRPNDLIRRTGRSYTEDGINVISVDVKPGRQIHRRIDDVKRVLKEMLHKMRRNPVINHSAIVSIVTFSEYADCAVEFSELHNISDRTIDNICDEADRTNVARGIDMALSRLDEESDLIRRAGNESYKPVLVFMSDGVPTDEPETAGRARDRVRQRSEEGSLNVIPIAIGATEETERWLKRMSKEGRVYHMVYDDEFDEVFQKIASRINRTATVISVDEALMADIATDPEDTASSSYGTTASEDELDEFMSRLGDV